MISLKGQIGDASKASDLAIPFWFGAVQLLVFFEEFVLSL